MWLREQQITKDKRVEVWKFVSSHTLYHMSSFKMQPKTKSAKGDAFSLYFLCSLGIKFVMYLYEVNGCPPKVRFWVCWLY